MSIQLREMADSIIRVDMQFGSCRISRPRATDRELNFWSQKRFDEDRERERLGVPSRGDLEIYRKTKSEEIRRALYGDRNDCNFVNGEQDEEGETNHGVQLKEIEKRKFMRFEHQESSKKRGRRTWLMGPLLGRMEEV